MKHLDVLARADLIERAKSGRTVRCRLKAAPMETAMQWLARYERFWTEQLDRLAAFRRGGTMLTKPSLTLKRRLKAAPAQVFSAWTDPEKLIHWFGPSETIAGSVQRRDGRARRAAATASASRPRTANITRSAASTARSCRPAGWSSPGPGTRRPSASRSSPSPMAEDGDGTILTLHHEQFFDEKARDGHQRGWTGTLEKLDRYLS